MNTLVVGTDKSPLFNTLTPPFLYLNDDINIGVRGRVFDPAKHCFNPLKDMDYRTALSFISVLDAVFPEGANTLTRRYSNFILLTALLKKPKRLSTFLSDSKDPYEKDAYQKVQRLLLSPVLKNVFEGPGDFPMTGTVLVKLDRAAIGDFDCFVLANLLIARYPGQVVIPDYGCYACGFHSGLIRQNRLTAGINSFAEVPEEMRHRLLLIEEKIGSHCAYDDALILAKHHYRGMAGTDGHDTYIKEAMGMLD